MDGLSQVKKQISPPAGFRVEFQTHPNYNLRSWLIKEANQQGKVTRQWRQKWHNIDVQS
jgi:hypothetical protein